MENLKKSIQITVETYKAGNLNKAEEQAKDLIKKNPNVAFIYNLLGLILMSLKKNAEAIKVFEKGIKIDPTFAMIYNNLGLLYFNSKFENNITKAEELYNKSISLNDKIAEPHTNLGNLKKCVNKMDDAIECHKKALSINPNFSFSYLNLGNIYIEIGKFNEAKINIEKAIELNSNLSIAHRTLSRLKKYKEGDIHINVLHEKYKNTLDINIYSKMDYAFALGKAYEDLKDYKKSFKYYESANYTYRKTLNFSIKEIKKEFNDIKKIYEKNLFEKFKNKNTNSKYQVIFILGMPRSGTTLVEQILSNHSKVFGAGEVNFIPDLMNKNFSTHNLNLFFQGVVKFNNDDLNKIAKEYIDKMIKSSSNKKIFTDKLPINFLWIGFIKLILPNSKIIHCYRNPKDNILSIYKNHFPGGKIDFGYKLDELVDYYNEYKSLMKHWHKLLPNFIYDIKYENLITNTNIEIRNLVKFTNLPWENSCLEYYENKRPIKTASDVQARKKIYKTSINAWKNYKNYLDVFFINLKN